MKFVILNIMCCLKGEQNVLKNFKLYKCMLGINCPVSYKVDNSF